MASQTMPHTHKSAVPAPAPLNLTLGVEFEFLIVKSFYPDKLPKCLEDKDQDYGKRLVHNVLSKPIDGHCADCGALHPFLLPLNSFSSGYEKHPSGSSVQKHNKWSVVPERDVELNDEEKSTLGHYSDAFAVELTSRVLHADQPAETGSLESDSHVHRVTYKDEISAVLQALHQAFNTPAGTTGHRTDTRMIANESCGLHVHVGNQRNGFPLQTVRNVLSVATICERIIDGMHDASRIDGSTIATMLPNHPQQDLVGEFPTHGDAYNHGLSEFFLCSAYKARRDLGQDRCSLDGHESTQYPQSLPHDDRIKQIALEFDIASFMELILHAPTLSTLQHMFSERMHKALVNLEHLTSLEPDPYAMANVSKHAQNPTSEHPPSDKYMAIEFRQHAGTMDAEEALCWIDFVQRLVKRSHSLTQEELIEVCKQRLLQPNFTLEDLLSLINVSPATKAHHTARRDDNSVANSALKAGEAVRAFGYENPLTPLCLKLIDDRRSTSSPAKIAQRVAEKLQRGGYGQFSAKDLKRLAKSHPLNEKQRRQLTIGYVVPVGSEKGVYADVEKEDEEVTRAPALGDKEDASSLGVEQPEVPDSWEDDCD